MMQFLKKYRFTIILILVLTALSFWFNPIQQNLYLKEDFKSIEKRSTTTLLWTIAIGAVIILIFALKSIKKIEETGNILLGTAALSLSVYIVFKTFFLSGFLAINRIGSSDRFEKKYITSSFIETGKQTPMIYDFRTGKTLFFDKVERTEKLTTLKTGDTIIISFRKGLLGIPFNPVIK